MFTLWLFNIAMENGPFIDGVPINNCDFPWLLNNQRVIPNDSGKAIPHGTHEAVNDHTRDFSWGKKDLPSFVAYVSCI
jgi:hypothetical protein